MPIRKRFAALASCLALQLLGGLTPAHVLCLHHGGGVTIERAARAAVRCDDAVVPCVRGGLGMAPGDDHCHDAAIAQPGLGRRAVTPAGSDVTVLAAHVGPALDGVSSGSIPPRGMAHGSPPQSQRLSQRTVVLRV